MPKDAKDAGEKLPDPKVREKCKYPRCKMVARFLENYCWMHLTEKAQKSYKEKIEKWVKAKRSLEGASMFLARLPDASMIGAELKKADLGAANLAGADFLNADLRESNLEVVDLEGANLLDADLRGANLAEANLQDAYLIYANFQGAKLAKVRWENARYLNWHQIIKVGEEKTKEWNDAEDAYRRLKIYFHQEGKYEDESNAYYREKLMAKHATFWQCFYGHQPNWAKPDKGLWKRFFPHLWEKIKEFFKWLGLWIFHVFTGFGERWWWTVLWALGFIAFFGFLYWGGGAAGCFKFAFKPEMIPSIFQYFYLSVVTFATLGFGDITPLCWQAQIPVVIEVIMGYVFLGLIITIIARRFGR